MLTGTPPFDARDAVELVHAHIARHPRPPHEVNSEVPLAASRIVFKLLEKEPERRYQTAEALAIDLREARSQWLREGTVVPFPLAYHDVPRELNIPDKLYGRNEQLETLNEAFVRACQGGRELVLVTGAPGIGKSALVSHLGRPVTGHHGLYIAGKFDQLQRSVPFSGLAQAFRALVRQLLTEPEPALAMWRERIEAAVAPNGQLLVDIVPELERILGPQLSVPEFGPVESKNRFHLVFTRFLRVFAQREHPLTLFLDDLQWVDTASLQLLAQWLGDTACHYLLLLGAYRDNEVGSSHPLALFLAAWREVGSAVHEIHLGPIGRDDVAQLAAEAFNEDVGKTRPLADLIMHKTAGNPFFVRRLLHLMHAEGFIDVQSLQAASPCMCMATSHASFSASAIF
jgi:predicted ATPase